MQDRFIELTRIDGTKVTLNVAHITAIGSEWKPTRVVGGQTMERKLIFWVSTSARQIFEVKEDYERVSSMVKRAHL